MPSFIPPAFAFLRVTFTFKGGSVTVGKGEKKTPMISYEELVRKLNDRGLTKTSLTKELGISSRTIAKIGRGEKIADRVLAKIAAFLNCKPEELYRCISDNTLFANTA